MKNWGVIPFQKFTLVDSKPPLGVFEYFVVVYINVHALPLSFAIEQTIVGQSRIIEFTILWLK